MGCGKKAQPPWLALRMEEGATSQGRWPPLDAGKGKEADSPPEPPEGTQPCQHPDRPVKPMSDFFPTDV